MNAAQILRQAAQAQRRIRDIERQRRHLSELATGAGVSFGGMRAGSAPHSRVESAALRLLDLEDDLADELAWCIDAVARASRIIRQMHSERHRRMLEMRYLECRSWKEIQLLLEYSQEKSLYRAHRRALDEAEKIFSGGCNVT